MEQKHRCSIETRPLLYCIADKIIPLALLVTFLLITLEGSYYFLLIRILKKTSNDPMGTKKCEKKLYYTWSIKKRHESSRFFPICAQTNQPLGGFL